jgi:hypothetical protein
MSHTYFPCIPSVMHIIVAFFLASHLFLSKTDPDFLILMLVF